ncbi:transcriptional regulator ATRX [Onthophagus taurus]|uniref:transcriptional regulator ATRX n=1 Tax=Onthophagus taurus TaxID=166361 RepID=UPI0039BE45D5
MEDLLTPQICMDIDETPLDVGADSDEDDTASTGSSIDDDDDAKVQHLLELEFKHPSQVPENLTEFEIEAKKNVFTAGELSVEFHRLHCTACNVHLGSAPINFFNRYIHPLLKVIVCKSCYNFYCSGEFDKDEDGSEMYCRWCGQGGKVMCCAQCAYVFCQKCVRQNLGKKTLEMIKDSDDWLCFGCNPSQLLNLKIICSSLYDFMQEEIRLAKALSNVERLKVDHSMCCGRTRSSSKRKRDEDETYNPYLEENKLSKRSKSMPKAPEKVVCAPDLSNIISDNKKDPPKVNKENKSQSILTYVPKKPVTQPPSSFYICSPTANVCKPNNANVIRIQNPTVKVVAATPTTVPLISSIPVHLAPDTKHEWFEKAATVVSTITGNLSLTIDTLTNELKGSKTVENLAQVHNKLQELLSTSINSLIQVRKSLRNQFLEDLNHLKFTAQNNAPRIQIAPVTQNVVKDENEDDDDVVIVNTPPKEIKQPTKNKENNGRPYLKVRSVSQLLKVPAECITIPDDPPIRSEVKTVNKVSVLMKEEKEESRQINEVKADVINKESLMNRNKENEDDIGINKKKGENLPLNNARNEDTPINKENQELVLISNEKEKNSNEEENNDNDKNTSSNIHTLLDKEINQEMEIINDKEKEKSESETNSNKIVDENNKKDTTEVLGNDEINKMLTEELLLPSSTEQSEIDNDEWINEDFEDHLACAIVPNKSDTSKKCVEIDNDDIGNCDNQNKNDSEKNIFDEDEIINKYREFDKNDEINKDEEIDKDEFNKDEEINKDLEINEDEFDKDEEINKNDDVINDEEINNDDEINNDEEIDEDDEIDKDENINIDKENKNERDVDEIINDDKTEENDKLNTEEEKRTVSNETVESESVEKLDELTIFDSNSELKETEKDSRTDNESIDCISDLDKIIEEMN